MHATLNFLLEKEDYATEKPFALRYKPVEGVKPTNIEIETKYDVLMHDVREMQDPPTFERNGFALTPMKSGMEYEDWFDDEKVKEIYFAEIRQKLSEIFQTSHVQIFEYRVSRDSAKSACDLIQRFANYVQKIRRRSRNFPVADGNVLQWAQPVRVAHIDFNLSEIRKMIYYHNGAKADEFVANRFQCVNVWKPLKGPVRDWPLTLCDASTVNASTDLVTGDVVFSDHSEENYQVHYNQKQRWCYISDQMPDEMWLFRCADSAESEVGPGVPYCSFPLGSEIVNEEPRESIEVRALIMRA